MIHEVSCQWYEDNLISVFLQSTIYLKTVSRLSVTQVTQVSGWITNKKSLQPSLEWSQGTGSLILVNNNLSNSIPVFEGRGRL